MFQLHFPLMGFAVIALIAAFILRRDAWAAAVWVPLMVAAAWGSGRLLSIVGANNGPEMEALGAVFALMFGWPWLVIFFASCFAFPRNWRVSPTVIGGLLSVGMVTASYYLSTVPLTVQVIGQDGRPAAAGFIKSAERDRVKEAQKYYATDANGRFSLRYDPEGLTDFEDDAEGIRFNVQGARKLDQRAPERSVHVQIWWKGIFQSSIAYVVPEREPIPVFLNQANVLVSPPLQDFIRGKLERAKAGAPIDFQSFSGLCGNAESFALIPEIAALISARVDARRTMIQALDGMAEQLASLYDFERRLGKTTLISQLDGPKRDLHSAICAWAGVEPGPNVMSTAPAVDAKIRAVADQLIAASRPYWGDEDSSVGVVTELGELGRPAFAQFPAELAHAQPRGRQTMLYALEERGKEPEAVEWALASNDPDLVAAAYNGLQERLDPEQSRLAVERLEKLNRADISPRAKMQMGYLLPAFRERAGLPTNAQ